MIGWLVGPVDVWVAVAMLERDDVGSFIVRDSRTYPGCYALAVKVSPTDARPASRGRHCLTTEYSIS